jgi:hypothetical protein
VPPPRVGGYAAVRGGRSHRCGVQGVRARGARFVGVVMQNVEIDGLVTHLVVNGVK